MLECAIDGSGSHEDNELVAKPLSDINTFRFNPDHKRHGLHGKTARRFESESYRRALQGDEISSSRVHHGLGRRGNRILWTAFEVEGCDVMASLNRAHAWDAVPSLLEEHAISAPEVTKLSDGTVETRFELEPVVEEVLHGGGESDETQAARSHRSRQPPVTDGKIYQLKSSRRPSLFAVPPTEPPVEVTGRTGGRLLLPVRVGDARHSHKFPLVRRESLAWDVTKAGGVGEAKLDVDLGGDCFITHVSTQGRRPPTRQYPQIRRERRKLSADLRGLRHSELGRRAKRSARAAHDAADDVESRETYSVEGRSWDLLTQGVYPGPFWDVLDLKGDTPNAHGKPYPPSLRWLQWVGKYRLLFRMDGGRAWHELGVYAGNGDATSEVAHDVRGLRARYLRFVPLEVTGGGAMRIGVFGTPCADAAASGGGVASVGSGARSEEDAPEPLTYTLRTCPPSLNTKYTFHAQHTYRGGRERQWWYYRLDGAPRQTRRLGAWREVAEEEELDWRAWAEHNEDLEPRSDVEALPEPRDAFGVTEAAYLRPADEDSEMMQLAVALSLSEMTISERGAHNDGEWQLWTGEEDASSELGSAAALVDANDASDAWSEVTASEWSDLGCESE